MPKKRKDAFFGLHFDFHSRGDKPVAPELRYDVITKLLDEVKPDYVQIDTKGHPGFSSYPTKVGNPAPKIIGDQVKMWRELTAERGIALYGHYSGLFDRTAAKLHPEWAIVDANGNVSENYMSVFGDYADKLLIPQLTELALDWKLDGAWVDGECWGVKPDYSPMALKKWNEISDSPIPKPGEIGYTDYLSFMRNGFSKYVSHYIEAVKAKAPDFEITSNWIYSAYMPESPTAPVDFLSGDYSPRNSVNSARINGRFIACQGLPWDLMSWGHESEANWATENRSTKEFAQYAQEAAYIMSLGGGFQFYNIQYGEGGTVQEWAIPIWAKTAEFVRKREPFAKGSKLVHETSVFLPSEAHYAEINEPYISYSLAEVSADGLIHISQDTGMSTEVIETHHLEHIGKYKLVMLGRADVLSEASVKALLDYVRNGGNLIAASPEVSKRLGFNIGSISDRLVHISCNNLLAPILTRFAPIAPMDADKKVGELYFDNYMKDGPYPAAVSRKLGNGHIIALAFDIGGCYQSNRTSCIKDFWRSLVLSMYDPLVKVSGSSYAELVLTERDGKLLINLLNHGGEHNSYGARGYAEIPPIGPLTVEINTVNAPKRITIEPEHIEWKGDMRRVRIERLDIHSIIVTEF